MRAIAATVTVTFGALVLAPTASAVQRYDWAPTPAGYSIEVRLADAMTKTEQTLDALKQNMRSGKGKKSEHPKLTRLRAELSDLDAEMSAKLAHTAETIRDKMLPIEILQRQQAVEAEFRSRMDELHENLRAVSKARGSSEERYAVERAKSHIRSKKQRRAHQAFDRDNLPNRTHRPNKDNKPKKRKIDFMQAGLHSNPYLQVAALGDFKFDQLPGATDPAYLAETDEIVLTQSIKDKASELEHDPVKIFHWVRNNVEWIPTWGAVQNAELTLSAQRGNAMDIASLNIALLRASGIPARYVHGTIEVSAERYMNWAGGFTDINAAATYGASGGIPVGTVETAGEISHIQLEHVWVEAAIDYFPSRGAINKAADAWVAMDPSYKQYEILEGLDAVAIAGVNPEQLANEFASTGTANVAEGWMSGFDSSALEAAQAQVQTALEDYIANSLDDPTVGDVIGGRKTIIQEFPILPSGLPNLVVTEGARYGKLPGNLQQTVSYRIGQSNGFSLDEPLTLPWPKVNNEKLTLSFRPATQADEDALQALLPAGEITDVSQLPGSIPAYLIEVVPEFKLNGAVIKSGQPMSLGDELTLSTRITYPGRSKSDSHSYSLPAGSYVSVQAIGQTVSPDKLRALQEKVEQTKLILQSAEQGQIVSLTREDLLGDLFYAGTLGYFSQLIAFGHVSGLAQQAHHSVSAGYGTLGYEPEVSYFYGLPISVESGGVALDVPWSQVSQTTSGDSERRQQFNMQMGVVGSTLEHRILEQLFQLEHIDEAQPDAISAAKAIQKAISQGQRIYQVSSATKDTALPNIHHDGATMKEIEDAIDVGLEVITHTDAVSVPGWTGAGYIILDLEQGTGAYKISGGANGGWKDVLGYFLVFMSGVGGLMDGYAASAGESEPFFNAQRAQYAAKLEKLSNRLAVFGFLTSVVVSLKDFAANDITYDQLIGQIASWLFAAATASYIATVMATAFFPLLAAILALVFSVLIAVLMNVFVEMYFTSRQLVSRNKAYA